MEVVKANKNDLSEILELQKLCYNENALRCNDFNIPPLTQTQTEIEKEFEYSTILKITNENTIVASVRAYMKIDTCYIGRLIVHPNYQNKGLGTKLMSEIEKTFDAPRFELFTGTLDKKNIYLYTKLGYNTFKEEQLAKNVSLVYLEKIINV